MDGPDEGKLAALFRDAASDGTAPPPGFDHSDVVAASRRITARRRSALAGGALALLVVAGVGVAGVVVTRESPTTAASAPDVASAPEAAPPPGAARENADAAGSAPLAGVPPLGPGDPSACANRQDPALRALVEQVLPEVVGAPVAATTTECRPGGERGVSVEVDGGLLVVQYLPPGTAVSLVEGAVSEPTASGGTVVVYSAPGRPDAPAPLAPRLPAAAAALAPHL